jgi:hypothetical protein
METAVVNTLRAALGDLLDQCNSNGISFQATFVNHSEGVAIMGEILSGQDFQKDGNYKGFLNEALNFGGPTLPSNSMNYIALGDPVSILAMANLFAFGRALWNNQIRFCCPTSLEFPHNFSGSAYQGALEGYMSSCKD